MKKVTKDVLKKTANNLMFDMTDEEYEQLVEDFEVVLKQIKIFESIEGIDDVEPMTFPYDVTNDYLREDEVTTPENRDDILRNANDVKDGQIRLPKVVK